MRIFIAIDIPDEIKERISALAKLFSSPEVSLVSKEAMHITLNFLGEVGPEKVKKIGADLGNVIKAKKFHVSISGIGYFTLKELRVIFAEVTEGKEEMITISTQISHYLASEGFEIEKDLVPHVTLARVKNSQEKQKLISLIKENSSKDFGDFIVTSIKLKSSKLSSEGPTYRDLKEFNL